jgi:hypothetical protein
MVYCNEESIQCWDVLMVMLPCHVYCWPFWKGTCWEESPFWKEHVERNLSLPLCFTCVDVCVFCPQYLISHLGQATVMIEAGTIWMSFLCKTHIFSRPLTIWMGSFTTLERGNYHIWVYPSFIQHKILTLMGFFAVSSPMTCTSLIQGLYSLILVSIILFQDFYVGWWEMCSFILIPSHSNIVAHGVYNKPTHTHIALKLLRYLNILCVKLYALLVV